MSDSTAPAAATHWRQAKLELLIGNTDAVNGWLDSIPSEDVRSLEIRGLRELYDYRLGAALAPSALAAWPAAFGGNRCGRPA